ncbi:MAG: flagellar basal body rod protein FlgC [Bacillota bacterium]
MKIFSSFAISTSALTAEKLRLDVIANNLANVNSTKTSQGGPFKRKTVVFQEQLDREISRTNKVMGPIGSGVQVSAIIEDNKTPFRMEHDPSHPQADQNGFVQYSNVNLLKELTDVITTQRSYQANLTVLNTARQIVEKALEIRS